MRSSLSRLLQSFSSRNEKILILNENETLNPRVEKRSKKEVIRIDLPLHLDQSRNRGTYNFYQKLFLLTSFTFLKIIQGNQHVEKHD